MNTENLLLSFAGTVFEPTAAATKWKGALLCFAAVWNARNNQSNNSDSDGVGANTFFVPYNSNSSSSSSSGRQTLTSLGEDFLHSRFAADVALQTLQRNKQQKQQQQHLQVHFLAQNNKHAFRLSVLQQHQQRRHANEIVALDQQHSLDDLKSSDELLKKLSALASFSHDGGVGCAAVAQHQQEQEEQKVRFLGADIVDVDRIATSMHRFPQFAARWVPCRLLPHNRPPSSVEEVAECWGYRECLVKCMGRCFSSPRAFDMRCVRLEELQEKKEEDARCGGEQQEVASSSSLRLMMPAKAYRVHLDEQEQAGRAKRPQAATNNANVDEERVKSDSVLYRERFTVLSSATTSLFAFSVPLQLDGDEATTKKHGFRICVVFGK